VSRSRVPFVRLGYLATIQSGITVDANRDHGSDSVTLPYLRVANVQDGHLDLGTITEIRVPRVVARSAMLRRGDVLMTEGGDLDKLGRGTVWNGEIKSCLHQNHVFAVRPYRGKLMPEYLALITQSSYARAYFESTGTKTTNLASTSSSKIRDFRIPFVDIDEQRRIADFLGAQTAQIDKAIKLIARQQQVLDHRYQATIDVEIDRTSGLIPLKYVAIIVDTEHKTAPAVTGSGYWIAGTASVHRGRIDHKALYETDMTSFQEWTARRRPRPGDVLLSREAPVGEVGFYRQEDPQIAIGQRMVLLSPQPERLSSEYLVWTLLSSRTRRFIDDVTQGSLHPHLNMSDIGSIRVGNISLSEQEAVAHRLGSTVGEFEALNELRRTQLSLLAERRQALITAAVTGEIDVTTARGVVV
jgi:restriction endonuclease S subunit